MLRNMSDDALFRLLMRAGGMLYRFARDEARRRAR